MKTIADLKGKRVAMGYSAMRNIDLASRAMLATAGLTEKDVQPVLVPNVIRSADDFVSGAADMFFFAFGAPKVREVNATVGGIRVLEIDEKGMPAARKIMKWGYLTDVAPGPVFVGVEKPMKVYSFDNILFTSAEGAGRLRLQVPRHAGEEQARSDRGAAGAARILGCRPATRNTMFPTIPARLKYFQERNLQPKDIHVSEERVVHGTATEERIIAGAEEFASAASSRTTVISTNVLQAALIAVVVLWVLDVPRQVFDISFYTEQLLTVCLGLTLALAFIAGEPRKPSAVRPRRRHRVDLRRGLPRLQLRQSRRDVAAGRSQVLVLDPCLDLDRQPRLRGAQLDWIAAGTSLLALRLHRRALRAA